MPALSDYVTGTITLTNGSAAFTGNATGWLLAGFKEGDTILDVAGASGRIGVIASITSNTAGTLSKAWEGPTLTNVAYRMRYQPDGARVSAQARNLIELLGSGAFFQYDASGTLAQRAQYNGEKQGFSFLDITTVPMGLYIKASDTSGDWAGPVAYAQGQKGETGFLGLFRGAWATATPYALRDFVVVNGASYIALIAHTSAAAFATDLAANRWQLVASKGDTGATGATPAVQPQGRLSLVSGVPTPETDVAAATSIYYVPATGSYLPIYDGTAMIARSVGTQVSLALDSNSGHSGFHSADTNFDVFGVWDSGAVKLGSNFWGQGGGSNTARGTGIYSCELELFNGVLVNKNDMFVRTGVAVTADYILVPARRATYLGSFRTTSAGQVPDTYQKRLLFNAYNQAFRPLVRNDIGVGTTWTYSTQTYRLANGDANSKVEFILGLAGVLVTARVVNLVRTSTSTARLVQTAIGLDGTFVPSAQLTGFARVQLDIDNVAAFYNGFPGLGYHSLNWLECGAGADTQTWYGSNFSIANKFMVGITGEFLG